LGEEGGRGLGFGGEGGGAFILGKKQIFKKIVAAFWRVIFMRGIIRYDFPLQTQWRPSSWVWRGDFICVREGVFRGIDFMRNYIAERQNAEM
jgi:hypothetical protein